MGDDQTTPRKSRKQSIEKPKRFVIEAFVVKGNGFIQDSDQDDTIGKEKEDESDSDDEDWDVEDEDQSTPLDDEKANDIWNSFKAQVLVCPMSTKKKTPPPGSDDTTDSSSARSGEQNNRLTGEILFNDSLNNMCFDFDMNISISFLAGGNEKQHLVGETGSNPTKKTATEICNANERWNKFYNNDAITSKPDTL